MQVGDVRRHRAARIDDDDAHPGPCLLRRGEALIEHRVAPGEVRADQHDEIGKLEVLVSPRHGVRAEGALVAGDRGRHAEARIGVDVGRADEALHQLVGDIIILGQQSGRRHRRRPSPARARRSSSRRCSRRGRGPNPSLPACHGWSESRSRPSRPRVSRERRALRAEPAEIGGMLRVAAHGDRAALADLGQHAAAHPAIGAGRADDAGAVDFSDCACHVRLRARRATPRRSGSSRRRA